jgi:membrane-associated protease RseP (regulator of RpoE activity)
VSTPPHGPVSPAATPALPRRPVRRHVVLFLLTVLTTTLVGADLYAGFSQNFARGPMTLSPQLLLSGLWYSATILAILGAHEFGHYFACRYYRVDASLPYFLPVPPPFITGTLGAFIRIRQPIASKRQLFDIGIAGPIAGFVVAVPALLVGISLSRVVAIPSDFEGFELGEPLLFRFAAWMIWGTQPDGFSINMHPMAFAAWFGLLATALNLFPVGQLDGGHISYAVLGRKSTVVTVATVAALIGMTLFFSMFWVVWTVLMVMMLIVFGPRHPSTFDEEIPLDRVRMWLAGFALLMFLLCFTPVPIELWSAG